MDTIITLTVEDMQEKSLNSNIEEVRLLLVKITLWILKNLGQTILHI